MYESFEIVHPDSDMRFYELFIIFNLVEITLSSLHPIILNCKVTQDSITFESVKIVASNFSRICKLGTFSFAQLNTF